MSLKRANAGLSALALVCACTAGPQPDTLPPASAADVASAASPPAAAVRPVRDTYHGVEVVDPYRWLEDWSDDEVREWSEQQDTYARSILDGLPHVEGIRARVEQILSAKTIRHYDLQARDDRLFAIKAEPPKQQPFLVELGANADPATARVLVDPNAIDAEGGTSIDWYDPSPDGSMIAVSLSHGGSESGDLHLYDRGSLREIEAPVPKVNGGTAGGDMAWMPDGSGLFYSRYPREGERPAEEMDGFVQVYFHRLGTDAKDDRYEIGKGFPRIAEIALDMDDETGRLLATVQDGDGGEFSHYVRTKAGKWKQLSEFGDGIVQAFFGPKRSIYLVSRKDAPRGKILRLRSPKLDAKRAKVVVPELEDSIVTSFWGASSVQATDTRLFVTYQLGGPSEIRAFDHDGKSMTAPKQLSLASVGGITQVGGGKIMFSSTSYTHPEAWYAFDPATGETEKTALATTPPVDLSGLEVVREFAISKDGTKVPLNIVLPRGFERDGSRPCLVTGYGGYGISRTPRYSASSAVLLEQGVCAVTANIRGGGEYGERWHREGNLTRKQNVFDDFAAVLQHLIDRKYTTAEGIAIIGGSNGGLLMGATMVQHPELVKVVVSSVGIYDMLRVELSPNGRFNITEFGTVKNKDQFEALYAYSPYHNVADDAAYPPTLFLTGANDPRVDPMQSRKMTARLQAATSSNAPILLRTESSTGHGGSTPLDIRIEQAAHVYAFLLHHLGVAYDTSRRL
jgi:prolyl oligopeptidase